MRVPEHRSAADDALKLLARFGMVGIAATILYAALVTPFIETARCHPIQPSLGAICRSHPVFVPGLQIPDVRVGPIASN